MSRIHSVYQNKYGLMKVSLKNILSVDCQSHNQNPTGFNKYFYFFCSALSQVEEPLGVISLD